MPLTHAEIAHLLGRSRSLVTKYVQRGMPIGSAEEARAWFDAHVEPRAQYMRAVPGKTAAARRPVNVQASAPTPQPPDLRPLAEKWLIDHDPETLEKIRDHVIAAIEADQDIYLPEKIFDALVSDRL